GRRAARGRPARRGGPAVWHPSCRTADRGAPRAGGDRRRAGRRAAVAPGLTSSSLASERLRLLREKPRGGRIGQSVAPWFAGPAIDGAEQIIPDRELGREVLAGRRVVDRVMPAMQLGAVDDPL